MTEAFYNQHITASADKLNIVDLQEVTPFEEPFNMDKALSLVQKEVDLLNLQVRPLFIHNTPSQLSTLERHIRVNWWKTGYDIFKNSLHSVGIQAYYRADEQQAWDRFSTAWQSANQLVNGQVWRSQIRKIKELFNEQEHNYIALFFRFAQQLWTREARWRSVTPSLDISPFLPLIRLQAMGCLVAGVVNSELVILVPTSKDDALKQPFDASLLNHKHLIPSGNKNIFISSQFRNQSITKTWIDFFKEHGYDVLFGILNERGEAIEVQLGRMLQNSCALIALVNDIDEDFGLPVWLTQETDASISLGIPTLVLKDQSQINDGFSQGTEVMSINLNHPAGTSKSYITQWLLKRAMQQDV